MGKDAQAKDLKKTIIQTAIKLSDKGLTPGCSGNVSVRFVGGRAQGGKAGMLITPTGMAYDEMSPQNIVFVTDDGHWDEGGLAPSSEWAFHLAAYKARPDMNALVHTHSNYATMLACLGKEIPAFHYMVAAGGGASIPCVPYALFGTKELSNHVFEGLQNHKACLMAHHGVIAMGKSLPKALELAEIIEDLSRQYITLMPLGDVPLLSDEQMAKVLDKFASYGQQKLD